MSTVCIEPSLECDLVSRDVPLVASGDFFLASFLLEFAMGGVLSLVAIEAGEEWVGSSLFGLRLLFLFFLDDAIVVSIQHEK